MLRRLIIAGLAAALAAPVFAITPASAHVTLGCTSFSGTATLTPGLAHFKTAQDVTAIGSLSCASGAEIGSVGVGTGAGHNPFRSGPPEYPGNPNGCPVAIGGEPPEYADQTPLIFAPDVGFAISWSTGGSSTGSAKTKAAPSGEVGKVRSVLKITAGKYAPGSPQDPDPGVHTSAKLKGKVTFTDADRSAAADVALCGDVTETSGRISNVILSLAAGDTTILQYK